MNNSDAYREANERVERFLAFGGVDLEGLDPEQREETLAYTRVGLGEIRDGVYRFRCPECGNVFDNDRDMEPLCTGPNLSLDEHEPTMMVRVGRRESTAIVVPGL